MEHKRYEKIRALGNAENEGILNGTVYIQEKIDGANLSIWMADGDIRVGSRSQDVTDGDGFRGAVEYIKRLQLGQLFLTLQNKYNTQDVRLFGEWLVPHTIGDYNPEAYNHFYLFDIEIDGESIDSLEVGQIAYDENIKYPHIYWIGENPSEEIIREFVGKSELGPKGEGIVIKNPNFINKFGNRVYAKIVGDKFKEDNMITFGGMQKGDNEMKIVLKYCTEGRVRKIINKIEQTQDRDIKMEDISVILSMLQYDIISEEVWNYSKYGIIDFKRLRGLIGKRGSKIAIGIINGEATSVAFL